MNAVSKDDEGASQSNERTKRSASGAPTLDRYFPSKELLILEPFANMFDYGRYLRARPADEPLAIALGATLVDLVDRHADLARSIPEIRRIVDASAVPRVRLWGHFRRRRLFCRRSPGTGSSVERLT